MTCLICGAEMGTAGCTESWRHGATQQPPFYIGRVDLKGGVTVSTPPAPTRFEFDLLAQRVGALERALREHSHPAPQEEPR